MKFVVGIDEVGRGPLAGPVTVCAVACEEGIYKKLKHSRGLPPVGKDSKKLKREDREKYDKILRELSLDGKINFKIVHISNKIIDARGISFAIRQALFKSLSDLKINPNSSKVLLDGGLKAPLEFKSQKTIIKGDEKERIISWASILAKVSRDSLMQKAGIKFPEYGFELHKGYGTLKHRESIKKHGISSFHRITFCKNYG